MRPDRRVETELLGTTALVGGMDEVGRGALAGPVSVGLAVVSAATSPDFPQGLADSKQVTARRREALIEPITAWVADCAVAHAWPGEIDSLGIMGALRLAGLRALEQVARRGFAPGAVILDGSANWLDAPEADLLADLEESGGRSAGPMIEIPPVRMEVKADARCAVVAAASILAKVERDRLMTELEDPGYGWASNKGYASAAHARALGRLGASPEHRRSWRLPGLAPC
ncbi:ribonuclease HII [Actinomyces slackii]|uniref:Ribonuclease n=1 Tax=Actinomyces slackii TaxID=52774 RepID=A0A3S4SUT9_9ACTO|nr:ribonuclease HII [Actinomyces slackii]VEG75609.1 Ribonuclease HII [Actinomyces slackii]